MIEAIDGGDEGRSRHREVARISVVRSLSVVDAVDSFRNQTVDVQVPLAMAVGSEIPRHIVDVGGEVGAVIEIEAPQEVLIRFAATGVLSSDQSGHGFEQFGNPQQRPNR
jgi:hypothetical protein